MNNKQLAHEWAHQTKSCGRGSHFYYEGAVIYSYGPHFPIARLVTPKRGEPFVLFTTRGYSPTTVKHKGYVRSACSHLVVYEVADVMYQATDARSVRKLAAAADKARRERESRLAALEQKRKAKAAKLLAQSPQIVAEWLAGTRHNLPRSLNLPVMLRRNGAEMETSKGARVPLSDAERTFRFLSSVREKGWHRNGEQHAIGSYQLDAVNGQGVVAGCHRVSWTEIDRFAKSQGWIG